MRGGVNRRVGQKRLDLARHGVNFTDSINLVSEKLHPYSVFVGVCGVNLDRVSPYPEFVSHKINIVALVLQIDKLV